MARKVPFADKVRKFVLGGVDKARESKSWVPSGPGATVGSAVKPEGWQTEAWRFWHILGEIRFPTEHLARQLGRLEWDVEINGVQIPKEEARAILDEVTYGIGLEEASRLGGLNLQVAGEGWWLEDEPGIFQFYSVVTPGLNQRVEELREAGRIAWRVYFPDPVNPKKAECAVQTCLGPADELLTLEGLSRAQSRSRIAQAGMLLVPSEASWEANSDPFGRDLETAMEAAIKDVSHPAAMVPIKVEMPEDLIDRVKHLTFTRAYDEKLHERIVQATKRIALGLDVPAELLLGVGDATHWTAWLTALETYTSHLEPLAQPLGDLYARLIETLAARTGRELTAKVTPNPKQLLAKRSTVRDALDAAKLGAVGLRYVREAIGASDEDAPTPEELEILLRIPREPGREPLVDEQTGEPEPSGPSPVTAALDPASSPVAGAMALAVSTVRSKVGAKLRAAVMSDQEMRDRIDGVENSEVVATLGADVAAELIDVNTTVMEALTPFQAWWARERPSPTSSKVATTLFGIWVADTLDRPGAEVASIPPAVISEVIAGRPAERGGTYAA